MKRLRLALVALVAVVGVGMLFFGTPKAFAAASTSCGTTAEGSQKCVILNVTLTGSSNVPSSGITVKATRNTQPSGMADNSFSLSKVSGDKTNTKWTSVNGVTGAYNTTVVSGGQSCSTSSNGNDDASTFDIVVQQNGKTVGNVSGVDLCSGESGPDSSLNKSKDVSIAVTLSGQKATKGGIDGTTPVDNSTASCSTASVVSVYGGPDKISQDNAKQFKVGSDSSYASALNDFTPGSGYTVSLLCQPTTDTGQSGAQTSTKNNVTVTAGKYTTVNFNSVAAANGSGAITGDGTSVGGSTASDDGNTGIACGGFTGDPISWALSWVACPIIDAMSSAGQAAENAIDSMLCINTNELTATKAGAPSASICSSNLTTAGNVQSSNGFKSAWEAFRGIALGLIAIAGLFMIISQGLGLEVFDAYTVKKTLPRIILAAIGISLSWWLLAWFVELSNALGIGIRGLIYAPFDAQNMSLVIQGGSGAFLGILTGVGLPIAGLGLAILGPIGILAGMATAVLAVFTAFFTLVIRNMLVLLLIILSPMAIAMYVLPNTEKYYKMWWDWLSRALMAFPIITAIIATGHVFAAVSTAASTNLLSTLVGFVAYFAPYFMIPMAFRMAGGALSTLTGMVNDRSKGVFDRLRNVRQNSFAGRKEKFDQGRLFGNGAVGSRLNKLGHGTHTAMSVLNDGGPGSFFQRYDAAMKSGHHDDVQELLSGKNAAWSAVFDHTDALAALGGKDVADRRRILMERGYEGQNLENTMGLVENAARQGNLESVQMAAGLRRFALTDGYTVDGENWDNGVAMDALAELAHGDSNQAYRLLGTAKGIAGQAGHNSFGGAGFGKLKEQMDAALKGNHADGDKIALSAFMSNDAVTVSRGKPIDVDRMTNAAITRAVEIHTKFKAGTATQEELSEMSQLIARIDNLEDTARDMGAPDRVDKIRKARAQTGIADAINEVELMVKNTPSVPSDSPLGVIRDSYRAARSSRSMDDRQNRQRLLDDQD